LIAVYFQEERACGKIEGNLDFQCTRRAMALARAVSDEKMSREILRTAAEVLKNSASKAKSRPEKMFP